MHARITVEKCHHIFHRTCLSTWEETSSTCPNCRGPLANPVAVGGVFWLVNNEGILSFRRMGPLESKIQQIESYYLRDLNFESIIRIALEYAEEINHLNPSVASMRVESFFRDLNLMNSRLQGSEPLRGFQMSYQLERDFRSVCMQHAEVLLDNYGYGQIWRLLSRSKYNPPPNPALVLPQNPPQPRPPARNMSTLEVSLVIGGFALLMFTACRCAFIFGDLCNSRIVLSPAQKADRKFFAKVLFVDISKLP